MLQYISFFSFLILSLDVVLVLTNETSNDLSGITGTAFDFENFPVLSNDERVENMTLYNYKQNYYGKHANSRLHRFSEWKTMDFVFPSDADRQSAINSGIYNPNNLVPIGVAAVRNFVFITMPVFFPTRNPASLAYYELPASTLSPQLKPYPDWSWHDRDSCNDIISAVRMKVDDCGRLWVIDSGLYDILAPEPNKICQPKVMVFDTLTNQLLFKVEIPDAFLSPPDSILISLEVEYLSPISCTAGIVTNAVIYVNDVMGYSLIVIDLSKPLNDRISLIKDKSFFPAPVAGTFNIAGVKFDLMDGIFALTLGPVLPGNNRELHYFSLASYQKYKVNTKFLRDKIFAANSENYKCTIYTRPNQSGGGVIDKRGVLFFGLLTDNAIGCWNTFKPPTRNNIAILGKDDQRFQFVTNISLDPNGGIWIMVSSLQRVLSNALSQTDANFRIFYSPSTDGLVRGTVCASNFNGNQYPSSSNGICY